MTENLYEVLASHFPQDQSRPVLRTGDDRVYSYGDLDAISGRFARFLLDLGAAPGDRIAVQVEKSPEALFLYLGALRAGLVYLPLNSAYTDNEVAYFLQDAEPAVLVCDPARAETLGRVATDAGVDYPLTLGEDGRGSLTEGSAACQPLVGATPRKSDDLAALLYTSGTTGRSKGAMLSHGNLAANAVTLHRIWGFRPDDVLLHALPLYHTHGLFVACHCALLTGGEMLFLTRFQARQVITLLPKATVMMGVPTFYTRLLAEPDFGRDVCAAMRLFISGSAPLLEETWHAFKERTGFDILERYGMTEIGMGTSNPLDGARCPGTVGPPLPDVQARICDPDGRALPAGEIGTLEVKGPNVFSGYWRRPDKNAEEFRADGFFITGDMARFDDKGYLQIVGRQKDLIISGGFNIYPKEVELVIDDLPGVVESAVIGIAHPDFGEGVAAVVVPASESEATLSEGRIIASCRETLAAFKTPKRVFFVEALPRNTMGKVQKNQLRERYQDSFRQT